MGSLTDAFNDKYEFTVRWNNRAEKQVAVIASKLCDDLNEAVDGVLEFEINPSYFEDSTFKLDCRKLDTGAHASMLAKVHGDLITYFDDENNWQAMSERNHESAVLRYAVELFGRKFGQMEADNHQGVIFKEELEL